MAEDLQREIEEKTHCFASFERALESPLGALLIFFGPSFSSSFVLLGPAFFGLFVPFTFSLVLFPCCFLGRI